ncbi:MAG: hypothetical protein ACOH5I_10335 [Oligoflexus sp.]
MEDLRTYLNRLAGKTIFVLSLTLVPGLLILFYVTKTQDLLASLAYIPCSLVIIGFSIYKVFWNRPNRRAIYSLAVDLGCVLGLIGCYLVVYRANAIGVVLTTSPIQTATVVCFFLNFHELKSGLIRNSAFTLLSIVCLQLTGIGFTASTSPQLIVGVALGFAGYGLLYFSLKNNYLYKVKVAEEKANDREKIRLLHKELENKCLPHQLELIMDGRSYSQTMPVEARNFWVTKLDISKSSRLNFSNKKKIFHEFFAESQKLLHANYRFQIKDARPGFDIDGAVRIESDGYLIKTAGDGYFVGYDYPFRLPETKMIGYSILLSILKQFKVFKDSVLVLDETCSVSAVQSLVYGEGGGVFSGKLHNYEIEGDVMTLAERYEGVRKESYLQEVEMRLFNRHFAIIMQNQVYQQFGSELPKYLADNFKRIDIFPHVRNDEKGTEIYVMYIHHDEIESKIAALEDMANRQKGAIPINDYRQASAKCVVG